MDIDKKNKISDITFIGSGISTSFTIINFLDYIDGNSINKKIAITIIDKYPEFNTGIPYGSRSGFSVLLITSLQDFLPEPELSNFINWLNNNKNWLLDEFKKDGGSLSEKWMTTYANQIKNNQWETLFIPRRFFGKYISEKVKNKIDKLKKQGSVEVNYIIAKVLDLEKNNKYYSLALDNKIEIYSKKVVLAIGSLPIKYLWGDKNILEKKNLLFINNPYEKELKKVFERVNDFLIKRIKKETNVLIVGANASGLEILYKLNDIDEIKPHINRFTFLSTQGLLPDALADESQQKSFIPSNLEALQNKNNLTAKTIAEATFKDLDYAKKVDVRAASTVGIISKTFGALLSKLDEKELEIFACNYGNEIGRRQRCAGFHYSKTVYELMNDKRFNHIAGRFHDIKKNIDNEFTLEYLETKSGYYKTHKAPVHIIINCIGSMTLTNNNNSGLIKNLIHKGYCEPNESKIGFKVNKSLESTENLHIIGPLLAGNVIEKKPIWHVEHCGRIIWLSCILSKNLNNYFFDKNKQN